MIYILYLFSRYEDNYHCHSGTNHRRVQLSMPLRHESSAGTKIITIVIQTRIIGDAIIIVTQVQILGGYNYHCHSGTNHWRVQLSLSLRHESSACTKLIIIVTQNESSAGTKTIIIVRHKSLSHETSRYQDHYHFTQVAQSQMFEVRDNYCCHKISQSRILEVPRQLLSSQYFYHESSRLRQ